MVGSITSVRAAGEISGGVEFRWYDRAVPPATVAVAGGLETVSCLVAAIAWPAVADVALVPPA